MVLVPGPHFLNGMLDLIRGRINLGATRLIYAVLVVVAISMGLLLGLALLGVSLPVDPVGRTVPLWHDVIAAGLAVACYSVFFSTPLRMLPWPVVVGTVAHALRWVGAHCVWGQRGDGRICCVPHRWSDSHSGIAPVAHALRSHRLRLCGLNDARVSSCSGWPVASCNLPTVRERRSSWMRRSLTAPSPFSLFSR